MIHGRTTSKPGAKLWMLKGHRYHQCINARETLSSPKTGFQSVRIGPGCKDVSWICPKEKPTWTGNVGMKALNNMHWIIKVVVFVEFKRLNVSILNIKCCHCNTFKINLNSHHSIVFLFNESMFSFLIQILLSKNYFHTRNAKTECKNFQSHCCELK